MARMYSRKKGKSRSKKPVRSESPKWVEMKPKEIETKVVELAKAGNSTSQIGLVLRDQHGVPDTKLAAKKSISQILTDNKMVPEIPEDLTALMKTAMRIRRHMNRHRMDKDAKRGVQLTESKIRRLVKYYKKTGVLPADWKYTPQKAALLVE